ncbi:MAG: hypothetical protein GX222_07840 [Ruminococcaceae bacterium]|nr:hypothetical protein [Oscillospiraceae bacterium]
MAITLHDKYAKQIGKAFSEKSFIAGRLSNKYDFTGVKTVKVMVPLTVPMTNYNRSAASNRYGTPTEMGDTVQEMQLTQDKSFSLTIDRGNKEDQSNLKIAASMLRLQVEQQAVPTMDKYIFEALSQKAGNSIASTKPAKTTIADLISTGVQTLDDNEIAQEKRILFLNAENYKFLKHSPEFLGIDTLGKAALEKGEVGYYDNMSVIKVPATRWPSGLCFLIVQGDSATAPVKLDETKLHTDPPGISGNLLEGRQYYDCFVFGHRSNGVYAFFDSAVATKTTTPTIAASGGVFSGVTGGTYHYTTDGSDPRYSMTVKMGSGSDVTTAGTVVKCYATKTGQIPSTVATQTLTA